MIYDEEYMNENYDRLLKTDTYLKTFISKVNVPIYKDGKMIATVKSGKDIALYDYEDYIENNKYYFNNFENVRLNHISKNTVDKVKSDIKNGLKNTISSQIRMVHILKIIDDERFEFKGKNRKLERWTKNNHDKINFEILTEYKKIDDVIELLDFWGKNKAKENGGMSFHGYDKNFFNQYYKDNKEKLGDDFISLFFYHNDRLVGLEILERTSDDFWILHTRKCDRVNYPNLTLYADICGFRMILEKYKIPFYVNIGFETGKRCLYKSKRFETYSEFKSFHLKFEKKKNIITTII